MNSTLKNDLGPEAEFQIRQRNECSDDAEYLKQFLWLSRPKLTKNVFMGLSDGLFVTSNCGGTGLEMVIGPASERAVQWESVPAAARQRLYMIYRSRAHYEAMLAQGQKTQQERAVECFKQLLAAIGNRVNKEPGLAPVNVNFNDPEFRKKFAKEISDIYGTPKNRLRHGLL